MTAYFDTSAVMKLLFVESESDALRSYLGGSPARASSALLRAELVRAANRLDGGRVGAARALLGSMILREIDDEVLDRAAELAPRRLGTLDAIHIATATLLGPDLEALVTYDRRMIEAARLYGLPVVSPG